MTKNEALKAAIDGKRVQHESWNNYYYITWDGSVFKTEAGERYYFYHASNVGWQIMPELVSFDEAWKAYEQGKKIQSEFWGSVEVVSKGAEPKTGYRWCFTPAEIRGQWQILDD